MKWPLATLVAVIALPISVAACLWDRDTPQSEAKGMPEVVAVLTGRFPRNPPLFYEMRLERVSAHLKKHPDDLAAYDDAGVACDRLGRGGEAIAWMHAKRAKLDGLDPSNAEVKEQRYRYHANLGTFLVHHWARTGADRSRLDQVKAARGEIARALEINPNAHFGREAYQLKVLDWIIQPPDVSDRRYFQYLQNPLGFDARDIYGEGTTPREADDAVKGLTGLIVLGNAWESVDIFNALDVALQRDSVGYDERRNGGRNTLAYFAWLRCRELIDAGKGTMIPGAPTGGVLKAWIPKPDFISTVGHFLDPAFVKLRAEADAWQAARTNFMLARLREGRHPDTDPTFWNGYHEAPAPRLPTQSVPDAYREYVDHRTRVTMAVFLIVPALSIATIVFASRALRRRRRSIPAESSRMLLGSVADRKRPSDEL